MILIHKQPSGGIWWWCAYQNHLIRASDDTHSRKSLMGNETSWFFLTDMRIWTEHIQYCSSIPLVENDECVVSNDESKLKMNIIEKQPITKNKAYKEQSNAERQNQRSMVTVTSSDLVCGSRRGFIRRAIVKTDTTF